MPSKRGSVLKSIAILALLSAPAVPVRAAPQPVRVWSTRAPARGIGGSTPVGIVLDGHGYVYVSCMYEPYFLKFDTSGTYVASWATFADGQDLMWEGQPVIDSHGNLWSVATDRVVEFTLQGQFLRQFGNEYPEDPLSLPASLTVTDDDSVFVCDTGHDQIVVFSAEGKRVRTWGASGSGPGQFKGPTGIVITPGGTIFVADFNNNRIQKFDRQGNFIMSWGSPGSGDGQFDGPAYLTLDGAGHLHVSDMHNNRIQVFDGNGTLLTRWGESGTEPGQFASPLGIAVDANGLVYVVDMENQRIQVFDFAVPVQATTWGEIKAMRAR